MNGIMSAVIAWFTTMLCETVFDVVSVVDGVLTFNDSHNVLDSPVVRCRCTVSVFVAVKVAVVLEAAAW